MTEIETLQRAKMYVEKMANGINPLTDEAINEDDFINNVRISRCLFYVSGILDKVIANGGNVSSNSKKKTLDSFPVGLLKQYQYREDKTINRIIQQLYEPVANQEIKKISGGSINNWLLACGLLEEKFDNRTNKKCRFVTPKGEIFGLRNEYKVSQMGGNEYLAIIYNRTGQENLISVFDKFLNGEVI